MADEIHSSNDIIESQLRERAQAVEAILDADLITYIGPIEDGLETVLQQIVEGISPRKERLAVVLETNGGYIEVTERIANIFRHHYPVVDFIVMSYAMSAGTVLVMSGDAIYMDYSATLGPIDPQVHRAGMDRFVPALGYLAQYERLVQKSAAGQLTSAELAYLIQNFDPAALYQYEQARDLSIALLEEWLVKYKFKNWTKTQTRGKQVSDATRKRRAREIAQRLNDTDRWHSHSRGIAMEVLRRELKIQIEDLEDTPGLHAAARRYYTLLTDYKSRLGHHIFVTHSKEDYHGH